MKSNEIKNIKSNKPIANLLNQLNNDDKFCEKFLEKRSLSNNYTETKYSENNESFSEISSLNLNDEKNDDSFNSSDFDEENFENNINIKKESNLNFIKNNEKNNNKFKLINNKFNFSGNNKNINYNNNSSNDNDDSYLEEIILDLENEFNEDD